MNPLDLFADQIPPKSFWNAPNGSAELWLKIILGLAIVTGMLIAVAKSGPQTRRLIVAAVTFISGAFYVAYFLWPTPINRKPDEIPSGLGERISFNLDDALPVVAQISNILGAFLLGLGVYSVLRIHLRRLSRQQRDWQYSVVLLVSMVAIVAFGYINWYQRKIALGGSRLDLPQNWGAVNYGYDLLFDGLLQQMDAAMFSVVAFYILSAAYRAFRIRSIEATILLASAIIAMLSLMGAVEYYWNGAVNPSHAHGIAQNFELTEISKWIRTAFQSPSIRAIDFGVGIGALAMGLRLWLSLERQGGQ